MKKLGIALLVLLVLAVGADRVADVAAQQLVADSLEDSQQLDDRPDVNITGFPFLTQVAAGSFYRVEVDLDAVAFGDQGLEFSTLKLDFEDVTRSGGQVSAARGRGEGVISFDALARYFEGTSFEYVDRDTVRVTASLTFPTEIEVSGTVDAALADRSIALGGLSAEGDVPAGVVSAVEDLLAEGVALSGIPFSVNVESLSVQRDGVHLALTGRDLSYAS